MMDFENTENFLALLCEIFPEHPAVNIPPELNDVYEGDIVYDFFHEKTWVVLSRNLDFQKNCDAMEKGVLYLSENAFRYYMPFYIYSSLLNDGWAFEDSFFDSYLIPGVMDDNHFLYFF